MNKEKKRRTIKEALYYLLRYKTKEVMGFVIIILTLLLISSMLHYDKKEGWRLRPSTMIENIFGEKK